MSVQARVRCVLEPGQYYGREIRRVVTAPITLVESAYPAAASLPPHAHQLPHFCIVLEGCHDERVSGRWLPRESGDTTYLPPGHDHAERHTTAGRHLMLELLPPLVARLAELGNLPATPQRVQSRRVMSVCRRLGEELRREDDLVPLAVEALGLELAIATVRLSAPAAENTAALPSWIRELQADVCRSPTARPPTPSAIAERTGLHPAQVARTFRRATGDTLGGFARRVRLTWTARRLTTTNTSISDLAAMAGFADQSHFTRAFKRQFGQTPALWRSSSTAFKERRRSRLD